MLSGRRYYTVALLSAYYTLSDAKDPHQSLTPSHNIISIFRVKRIAKERAILQHQLIVLIKLFLQVLTLLFWLVFLVFYGIY